jgi:hypothetical protein
MERNEPNNCKEVIINIMETINSDQMINNAIKFINSQESFVRYLMNIYYWLLVNLTFNFYFKKFDISNVIIKFGNDTRLLNEKHLKLTLLDNGINIFNYFISYDVIQSFSYTRNTINIVFFGRVDFSNKTAKITIGNSTTFLSFKVSKNTSSICNIIKWNMYYHIKYGSVDKKMIDYITTV